MGYVSLRRPDRNIESDGGLVVVLSRRLCWILHSPGSQAVNAYNSGPHSSLQATALGGRLVVGGSGEGRGSQQTGAEGWRARGGETLSGLKRRRLFYPSSIRRVLSGLRRPFIPRA